MASVKQKLLQLFDDERLLAFCHVAKQFKKKKTSYLCLTVNVEVPPKTIIHQIKNEKNLKKKRSWSLNELRVLDGKNDASENPELDMHCDKVYQWVCFTANERKHFVHTIWKQAMKYQLNVSFRGIPKSWLVDDVITPDIPSPSSDSMEDSVELPGDHQAITDREENDLSKLMANCEFAISNAEAFMNVISRDLSLLDGENVQSVLASEAQVEALMNQLEDAIKEAEKIEFRLDSYDEILCNVRDAMENMERKNMMIEIANKNNHKLLNELHSIISQLDISHEHHVALADAELTTAKGLASAIAAAHALRAAMNCQLDPALLRLTAVQDQRKKFEKLRETFAKSVFRQLNNLFVHLGNDKGEQPQEDLTLPKHETVHKELIIYTELMHWLKAMDRKSYTQLRKIYTDSLGKLYERDIKMFFEQAKETVNGFSKDSREDLGKNKHNASKQVNSTGVLLGIDRDQWVLEATTSDRQRYETTLERVLAQLEPVCLAEQQFSVTFFQLDVLSPTTKNTETTLDGIPSSSSTVEDDLSALPQKRLTKQINKEVRGMMSTLFSCLEEELINFISHLEKQDSFYCMYVLVRLSQHVLLAEDTGSFLSMTFANALVNVKRSFDRFMQMQVESIQEARPPRRSKCGILPYVSNLEEFAKNTETVFGNERRTDLDKWYVRLVDTMMEYVPRHAADHHKTPPDVVKMENYHHLFALLSQLKISVLDSQRKEAKVLYNEALSSYVTHYFGRPLEKLNQFFEGVQARVAGGVKISEIGYQLAFSKQELRKVISQYPSREVKKGLENLYKKVEKHLSEEENLLQVVWRAMQEEFIRQYKNLEELIQRCYPGSRIVLEFAIEDILEFFSDIARSH